MVTMSHAASMRQAASAKPRVSVVIPTFNRATLLLEAVASVQAQSYPDWEIIIADDFCNAIASKTRNRISYFNK